MTGLLGDDLKNFLMLRFYFSIEPVGNTFDVADNDGQWSAQFVGNLIQKFGFETREIFCFFFFLLREFKLCFGFALGDEVALPIANPIMRMPNDAIPP